MRTVEELVEGKILFRKNFENLIKKEGYDVIGFTYYRSNAGLSCEITVFYNSRLPYQKPKTGNILIIDQSFENEDGHLGDEIRFVSKKTIKYFL